MAQNKRLYLGLFITLIVILILGVFVFFNTRLFASGPQINILEPQNGSSFDHSFIEIKGVAINTSFISINDHPISIDEQGNFNQKLLLSPGISIIKFYAHDKFNRETTFNFQYFYTGDQVAANSDEELIETITEENSTSTGNEI
jgi:hypothetical protein